MEIAIVSITTYRIYLTTEELTDLKIPQKLMFFQSFLIDKKTVNYPLAL